MANAKKCDRCGGYFDISSNNFNRLSLYNSYRTSDNGKMFDLCPTCMANLRTWLDGKDTMLVNPKTTDKKAAETKRKAHLIEINPNISPEYKQKLISELIGGEHA